MNTKDFLQLVTADGIRCVVVQTPVGMMQLPAHDIDEAVKLIDRYDSKQQNVYYALGTFKETHTNDKGKERVSRKRKNVARLGSLWLDIDFKDCQPANDKGALAALASFLTETDWPRPSAIVSSGNGMHVYWKLSSPATLDEWLPVAQGFKDLCQVQALPADHACTADAARVLRPVGTHNWKDRNNPKAVRLLRATGDHYTLTELHERLGTVGGVGERVSSRPSGTHGSDAIPEHLRKAAAQSKGASEYTKGNNRTANIRNLFDKGRGCGVFRHVLATGGKLQSEPEWSATLNILAHAKADRKLVHAMSKGHIGYDEATTDEKYDLKVEAVEDGTGPTLCRSFEGYYEAICKACPWHKHKKCKTPKSLMFMDFSPAPAQKSGVPKLVPVAALQQPATIPAKYRISPCGKEMEKHVWNADTKQMEWEPVLRSVWMLKKATRLIQSRSYGLLLENRSGKTRSEIELPFWMFGNDNKMRETLADKGCSFAYTNEYKEFKLLVETWLDELKELNKVEDVTGQLGWIVDENDPDMKVVGFATGTTAYYTDGTKREGVVAESNKYKGIAPHFKPKGDPKVWRDAAAAIVEQGCDHIIAMLTTSFAAPLIRFTGQPGCVVSLVSNNSAAGKTTAMQVAQAVWANPTATPATLTDTDTVIRNKLAFLQNLPSYWDEVRGNEQEMAKFGKTAFHVTQGRDRERANSKAETIRAEEWQTLLAACSNESLFDVIAEASGDTNAGIYRVFELMVDNNEFPPKDNEIMSMVAQLHSNYGHAGQVYGEFLANNYDRIRLEVEEARLVLDRALNLATPERFWLAAITSMLLGAKYAEECGLVSIDRRKLRDYLLRHLRNLRARATDNKTRLDPRELVAAFSQSFQDGRVTVDKFPIGRGRQEVVLLGNHSHVKKPMMVLAKETNLLMVLKSDFRTWLWKSKGLKWTPNMIERFEEELKMMEQKSFLAAGTKFKLDTRANCLIFNLDENIEDDENAE